MYPNTFFEIIDNSFIPSIPEKTIAYPLFMMGFSSEKGPEDLRVVKGDKFYKLYGEEISFKKHGQPLLQASNIIDNGGTILCKRVVAKDATLANVAVIAKIKSGGELQITDDLGRALYVDVNGEQTINPVGTVPLKTKLKPIITYECVSVENAKNMSTIDTEIAKKVKVNDGETTYEYPLFILADNGRGNSGKRFRITPDYNTSKYSKYMSYVFSTIEDNKVVESFVFTLNPDIIKSGLNMSIENVIKTSSNQLTCKMYEDNIKEFVGKLADMCQEPADELMSVDLLFGKDRKSNELKTIEVNLNDGFNLSYSYGLDLENGTNGNFGDIPFGTKVYETELVEFFNGTFTNEIYDVDNYKLDLIVDANYPTPVKRAIEAFVDFREDVFYYRDMGLGLTNMQDILNADIPNSKSRYCATYHNSYDILDPFTKKQISVTIGYSISRLMINHFKNGRCRPTAGLLYNMTIPEAIDGTINFLPKVTPLYDQKQQLDDARINYASCFDNVLTIETLYTSQEVLTQLSYINNVLAVQEVIKAIRTKCPKTRYSFLDGDDLEKYKDDVQIEINKFTSNFLSLKMVYTKDETMINNKIFYASLEVKFRNFVQAEYFKIYAMI